ncbi:MAG: hypothetical protein V3V14_04380 [Saprospiraceae bacterium]
MYKLILLSLSILFLSSCIESGVIYVDLSKKDNTVYLKPKGALTSSCKLHFTGFSKCDVRIGIQASGSVEIKAGEFSIFKKYECYSSGKRIRVLSENCTDNSFLAIKYVYSSGYYGQKSPYKE